MQTSRTSETRAYPETRLTGPTEIDFHFELPLSEESAVTTNVSRPNETRTRTGSEIGALEVATVGLIQCRGPS